MDILSPVPNHHASHPGFSGARGLLAAVLFLFGRDRASELALDLAQLQSGDRVVDIGCGPGVAAKRARSIGAEVVGVDPAEVMLRVARRRWGSNAGLAWRIGAAETIPVEDDWATVVWSLAAVHHWADIDAALDELSRVMAPGGRLVIMERRIVDTEADGVASHGWTEAQSESFASMCRDHGFDDVTTAVHPGKSTVLSVVARRPD